MHEIAEILFSTETPSTFAVRRTCEADVLEMSVKGVGAVKLPVTATTARKLLEVARPAPFGWRDETRHDPAVRDTWQVAKSRVRIDKRRFNAALRPHLEAMREQLGLAGDARLVAELDKLLVYAPGQFFLPHRDSERDGAMVGSLQVILPSRYRGGQLVVHHDGETKSFGRTRASGSKLSLVAFYGDCEHEVKPVEGGYRVVLSYHLLLERRKTKDAAVAVAPTMVDRLCRALSTHFSTPVPQSRWSREPPAAPDRLIYLLDHAYSSRSLRWERLKRDDRRTAEALRLAADRVDAECFLMLADVHESWNCADNRGGWGYGRSRRYRRYIEEEEEEAVTDLDELELLDLIDSDIELRHGVDARGKAAPKMAQGVSHSEIVMATPTSDLPHFAWEHEGWMGNYGNTVDRWYHRAAVVLWPRSRSFEITAAGDPAWALRQIRKKLDEGDEEAATAMAAGLRPNPLWGRRAEENRRFFVDALAVAAGVDDGELATQLLSHFRAQLLAEEMVEPLVAAIAKHGANWAQALFSHWHGRSRWRGSWHAILPSLCQHLMESRSPGAKAFAAWLVDDEAARFMTPRHRFRARYGGRLDDAARVEAADRLGALLDAAATARRKKTRNDLLRFLKTHEREFPITTQAELLIAWRQRWPPARLRALGLGGLYDHVVKTLDRIVRSPERSEDDWSIAWSSDCDCELCEELDDFLAHSDHSILEWPLAKDSRQHLHRVLDAGGLPVSHTTRREGRPFTLVLTKKPALFEDARALRARQRDLLKQLRSASREFRGTGS